MRIIFLFLMCALVASCATPNVWVASKTQNSGVIAYQNYNPASDGGRRIEALIPCRNHVMTWNGQKSQSTVAATYFIGENYIAPIDDGVRSWVEYHYKCLNSTSTSNSADSSGTRIGNKLIVLDFKTCKDSCELSEENGELRRGENVSSCISKTCAGLNNIEVENRTPSATCCRVCNVGKACGNSCIERSKTCHQPPGCACD